MIVSYDEAIFIYEKIDPKYRSFYYHPKYVLADAEEKGLEAAFFCIEEEGNIFYHAFHLGVTPLDGMHDIQSPYGYGGPIAIGLPLFIENSYKKYKEWCQQHNILVEFIRFYPVIENNTFYTGKTIINRNTVVIDLNQENLLKSFSTRVRTAIRNAQKNDVQVVITKDEKALNDFYTIYTNLMEKKKTNDEYFFSLNYFKQIINHEKVKLFVAYLKDRCLGGAIFFEEEELSDYHLSATTEEGKKLNVSHLLIYSFAESAKRERLNYLYLGGGTSNQENDSLLFFKKGFSKEIKPFYIGYKIFNEDKYYKLKESYMNSVGWILFYRL